MRLVATVEGQNIVENDDLSVHYLGAGRIDSDGIGPHHGDHTADNNTSLHFNGRPLNADVDKYIVVPIEIVQRVKGVVLGSQAQATNTLNGKHTAAVVGDIGNRTHPPTTRLGEISCACASALGLNPSPVDGGTDEHVIEYIIFPGVPAVVDGKTYHLQPV